METRERRPLVAATTDVLASVLSEVPSSRAPERAALSESNQAALDAAIHERDLYRRLLELGSQDEIEPFLDEALRFVCEIADANEGYLELRAPDDGEPEPRWW